MKHLAFSLCFCTFFSISDAQLKGSNELEKMQKTQSLKSSNIFLSSKAAFDLYKKINKSAVENPVIPAGSPLSYTFVWPQLKDEENELFFNAPISSAGAKAICLTTGDVMIQIPHCQAAGFYMLQINCNFHYARNTEMTLASYSGPLSTDKQTTTASMDVTQGKETSFVLGVNLLSGMNTLRINCLNNEWDFFSLRILPFQ